MKSKSTAVLLCFFLGGFGAQAFYLDRTVRGVLSLVFFWTFIPTMIAFVEFFILLCMSDIEFNRKYNEQ